MTLKNCFFCLGQVKASRLSSGTYKEFGRFGFWWVFNTKNFCLSWNKEKREPCIFIFRLLSLYDTESSCAAQHLIFFLVAKREEIFFSWVLSSLECKLSCWKTTLSFLKALFTTWLDFLFWESTFNIYLVSDFSFSFYVSFVWFCQRKTKLFFVLWREKIWYTFVSSHWN